MEEGRTSIPLSTFSSHGRKSTPTQIAYSPLYEQLSPERNLTFPNDSQESNLNEENSFNPLYSGAENTLLEGFDDPIPLPVADSAFSFLLQAVPTLIISGFGLMAAGMVLDVVQHWRVFEQVSELYILVPSLLCLKGNLEMTLAARLSTACNLGYLDCPTQRYKIVVTNLAVLQVQAVVVGLLAAIAAIGLGVVVHHSFDMMESLVIICCSVGTSMICGFILGLFMAVVIVGSRKLDVNPDNIATPIAASFGDLVTLLVLASTSEFTFGWTEHIKFWVLPLLLFFTFAAVPLFWMVAQSHRSVSGVLKNGWSPILVAILISSLGGLVLERQVSSFKGLAALSPIMNGLGGNMAAIYSCRFSTMLHSSTLFNQKSLRHVVISLLAVVAPLHLFFLVIMDIFGVGHSSNSVVFLSIYCTIALIQLILLLWLGKQLVLHFWKRGIDPDNFVLPYLTALGDLIGTALLALGFALQMSLEKPAER